MATALALLQPLGAGAPGVIADGLDLDPAHVAEQLSRLVRAGVFVPGRSGGRFDTPLTAEELSSLLGRSREPTSRPSPSRLCGRERRRWTTPDS
ncbi:hypothetical protein HX744_02630 [Pseudonocardia sp. ICBG1122]|nr:hypothetical protein [Pseudonocardia pini]